MSNPRMFSAQVAHENEEALTTLRELLERIDEESSATQDDFGAVSDLLAQTVNDAPLRSRYGNDIKLAAIVRILDDLASRVRELEAEKEEAATKK